MTMDLAMIGSASAYTKNLRMRTQWELKKASGDVTAHGKSLGDMLSKTPTASAVREKISGGESEKEDDAKLEEIKNKMFSGQKLTAEERKYLQEKDPEDYQKLEEAERRQQQFEQDLKRCRTKEDVQRVKMSYVGVSMDRARFIEAKILHNPNVPEEKKLALVKMEALKERQTEEAVNKFVKSKEYAALPTDREKEEVERGEREEREARRIGEKGKPVEGAPETERETRPAGERREGKADAASRPETQEERKVRRARARAAYAAVLDMTDADEGETVRAEA